MEEKGYICLKPCTVSGTSYQPGERIPEGRVLPSRVRALSLQGYIGSLRAGESTGKGPAQEQIRLPIRTEKGELTLTVTQEQLSLITGVLQRSAREAVEALAAVDPGTDEAVFIAVHALDSRRTVKDAICDRMKKREESGKEGTESGDA